MKKTISIFFFISIISTFTVAGQRISQPSGVFYYEPASSVFGSQSVWVNPAGLSSFRASGYHLMADYYNGRYAKSWGSVVNRDALGFAYRKIYNPDGVDFKEYIFAGGFKIGQSMNLGVSYQYFKEGPSFYNKRHLWNVGLLGPAGPKFKYGVIFSNLNRGRIDGVRTETEMRYSLSYRPYGNKITFSTDMFLSTKTKIGNADFIYHVEYTPARGVYLNGYIDDNKNFQIGIRINLLRSFLGARRTSDKNGNHRGSTFYFGSTDMRQESVIKEPKRRMNLSLGGTLSENPVQPVIGKKKPSFLFTLLDVYRAADDDAIKELFLKINRLSIGFSQAQELKNAIDYFKSKNKPVICHLNYPSNISYYIAASADSIIIPPVSQLNLVGLKAELTFYASSLEKLGIKIDLMQIADYKTAAETYTRTASSPENKEQINRILDDLYNQFIEGIALGRNISNDSVKMIIDQGPYTSVEALRYGIVDGLAYLDEIEPAFLSQTKTVSQTTYHTDTLINTSWEQSDKIGIVVAGGEVAYSSNAMSPWSSSTDVTPQKMKSAVKRALQEPATKAVILRVDSPGGVAIAGQEIYHTFSKEARHKPFFVSMGNVAASGGYHIAMAGQMIFANPATLTGSIGIYGGKADFSGFYEKISLGKEIYTRGKYAGMMSNISPFTPEERIKYFSHLKAMYDHFVGLVAENRNMPADSIEQIAQGKVWTGNEAKKNGLVDQLGGIKETLDFTAARLQLSDYRVDIYPKKTPFILFPGKSIFTSVMNILSSDKKDHNIVDVLLPVEDTDLYTRLPYDIIIE